MEKENEPAFQKRGVPRMILIKGNELFYKDPPTKENLFIYRCRKKACKYYIKIDRINIDKIIKKDEDINYNEYNSHLNHEISNEKKIENQKGEEIRTEKEIKELAINLIKNNINENLEFHYQNLHLNKIKWNKN